MTVHRNLGPALREDSYQRALALSLEDAGLSFEAQKMYSVFDSQDQPRLVGYYIPDFVVEEKIVLEIKALRGLDNSHLAQVIGYLAVSGCPLGIVGKFWRAQPASPACFSTQQDRRSSDQPPVVVRARVVEVLI